MLTCLKSMKWFGAKDRDDMPKPMRIVVVGEKGTGKSTLIMAATNDHNFNPRVPPQLPYTNLPSEFFPDRLPATIIDTSSRPEDKEKVVKEVKQADSIVLTFAYDRQETLDRLSEYWLPLFRELEVRVPIIMAAYKLDIIETSSENSIENTTAAIMQQYQEIETALLWSARTLKQARNILYYAQKAVIHPAGPIFDQETNSLKPRCVAALKRIFMLTDHNSDCVLSDMELNDFQVKCFNVPLSQFATREIKKVMQAKFPQGVNDKGLTLEGFLFLNSLFVEEGRIETLWTILRKFGYNNEIRLSDDMIPYSSLKRGADQSVELTSRAIRFLMDVYELVDKNQDNMLAPYEIGYIFQTAPENPWNEAPYKNAAVKIKYGGMSVEAFVSLWSLMTLIEPAKSLEYLMYITYPYDLSSAIRVTRARELDRMEKKSERKVVQCFVFGPKNAGKSALLNQLIRRPYDDDNNNNGSSTDDERYVVNMFKGSGSVAKQMKFLVMKEIRYQEDGFILSNEALAACDVAIFLFDASDESSWNKSIELLSEVVIMGKNAGYEFPCLMVAAKTDLEPFHMATQDAALVTQTIGIEAPIPISCKMGDFDYLFNKIITAAEHPHLNIPNIEPKKKGSSKITTNRSLMVVSIGTAVFVVGLASFRLYVASKQS